MLTLLDSGITLYMADYFATPTDIGGGPLHCASPFLFTTIFNYNYKGDYYYDYY